MSLRGFCCTLRELAWFRAGLGPSQQVRAYGWLGLRPQQLLQHSRRPRPAQWQAAAASSAATDWGAEAPAVQQHSGERKHYSCPACGQRCYRAAVLQRHLFKCCPDIVRIEVRAGQVRGASGSPI